MDYPTQKEFFKVVPLSLNNLFSFIIDAAYNMKIVFLQLVCTTEECLAVWSLISLTIKYIVRNKPVCLAADPFSNKMVVVTRDNDGMDYESLYAEIRTFICSIFFNYFKLCK